MARAEARLLVSIWDDADFLALSPGAQRLFMFLLSQKDLAHDGVIALRERRWSKAAGGLTVDQIRNDLDELATARFIVVDDDTEELLLRSFIRRDKVYRQPNVFHSAADHLATVTSLRILAAVAAELDRIEKTGDLPDGSKKALAIMRAIADKGCDTPSPNPTPNPTPNPSDNPSDKGTPRSPGERGVVTAVSSASPYSEIQIPENSPPGSSARSRARERATRIPDDFTVPRDLEAWCREKYPHINGRAETDRFIDYWRGIAGERGRKLDWPATWRNWIRNAAERTGTSPARHLTPVQAQLPDDPGDAFNELRSRADAQAAARLIGELWREPSKPPSDKTPTAEWKRARNVEWIDEHEQRIRTALTSQRSTA